MTRLAVLIPHYNNTRGLLRSVQSIAADDPGDVYVVDDGSPSPPTTEQIQSAVAGDRAVRLIALTENAGIETALNTGLDAIVTAGYEFVARLDCGDLNVGRRFSLQVEYMDAHPNVILLGGAARFVDPQGETLFVRQMPTKHADIARFMRANNAFMHPSVVMRSSAVSRVGHYPTRFPAAEDYAYFWSFVEAGEVANLPDVLIDYEVDPASISRSKRDRQLRSRLQVQRLHSDGSLGARAAILRTRLLLAAPVGLVDRVKARMYGQP